MSDEKKCCEPLNVPGLVPGWVCGKCPPNARTFNGGNRDRCKVCDHERCDPTPVKLIAIQEEDGFRVVPVHTNAPKKDLN